MPSLNATKLYAILIATLVIIVALIVGGFYLAHEKLSAFATDVNKSVAESEDSSHSLQRLQKTEEKLEQEQQTIKDVKKIVAVAESYKYQNQIINDINKYAKKSDITVTQYTFDPSSSGGGGGTTAATTPAEGGEPGARTPSGTASGGASLKTASVSVAVKNPTNYRDLLKFIKYIENNLTNMQISSISLASGDKKSEVTTDTFNIKVHIK